MLKKGLIVFGVIAVIGIVFGWKHGMAYLNGIKKTVNLEEVLIPVRKNATFQDVADELKEKGAIDDVESLIELVEYKQLTDKSLNRGMFAIPSGTSYRDLLNGLVSGKLEVEVKVTFNNCRTIRDLCKKVAACLDLDASGLESYILDNATLKKYDFTEETVPALFIPNTYRMYYDTDQEAFVQRMAEEFKKFWTPERMGRLKEIGLKSPSQAVTLASIVYGEQSKNAQEWPVIAGLYLNRLRIGMRLQSDPTFKFCWGDELEGVQRLTYEHRSKDCPYNTYLHEGLPPGPISMPPAGVVDAVLHPDRNDYLYMCAQPNYDGLHNFAKDYAVHAKNAAEFQRWLAAEL